MTFRALFPSAIKKLRLHCHSDFFHLRFSGHLIQGARNGVLTALSFLVFIGAARAQSPPSRPILFVHGFCGSAADFQSFLGPLYQQLDPTLYPSSAVYYVRYDNAQHLLSFFDSSGSSVGEGSIPSNTRFFAIELYDPIDDTTDSSHVAKISILNKAYEIDQAVKQITTVTHVKDVIIVAHSMGGLDARAYIENMASPTGCYDYVNNTPYYVSPQCAPGSGDAAYAGEVGDLITVDTPHLGSPLAAAPNLPGACFLNSSTNKTELELAPLGGSGLIEALNYNHLPVAGATPALYTAPTQAVEDYLTDISTSWTGVTGESDDIVTQPSQSVVLNIPAADSTAPLKDVQVSYLSTDSGIAATPGCWYPFAGLNFQVLHFMPCLGAQPNTQSAVTNQIIAHDTGTLTTIEVQATYNGAPWSGDITYQVSGPNEYSSPESVVPMQVSDLPLGTYTISNVSGGPSTNYTISPSSTQLLGWSSDYQSRTWALNFSIDFKSTAAPSVTTGSATSVSSTNATLSGMINPNGGATQFQFLYGTSQTLAGATTVGPYSMASSTISETVYQSLSGLEAGKTYYFELQAWNSANSSSNPTNGGIVSFATSSAAKSTPLVSVAPGSQSITTAQPVSVSVAVVGSSGTPTGSVTLTGGGYNSSAPLVNGSVLFNISAGQLLVGSDTLTATYTPDSASSPIYNAATGNTTVSVTTPGKLTPTVAVSPLSTSITTAQSVTVNVSVYTSSGPSPTGTVTVTTGSYTSQATPLTNASASVVISGSSLSPGTYTPTAHYSGDNNFNSASGTSNNSVTVTEAPTATLTVSVSGNGSVTSSDGHINCPSTCSYAYTPGASVTLNANEAAGYYDQWAGCDGVTGNNQCLLTMTQSRTVSIVFTQQPTGIMLVQPGSYAFPPQVLGTSSTAQPELVIANGGAALDQVFASVGGLNAADFALNNQCPTYGVNSTCYLYITFTPGGLGTRTASLTVSSANATITPQVFALSGAGVVIPTVSVTQSATAIAASQALTLDVSVSGSYGTPTGSLSVYSGGYSLTGVSLSGGNAVVNIPGGSLAPGTDVISVEYRPDSVSSTVYLYAAASVSVTVAGATSYSAPTEPVGTQSSTQTATILFPTSATLGSITATTMGATNLDFNVASGGTCTIGTGYTVGQTCTVNYIFAPTAPGTRMGAIDLYDNASPTPNLISTVYLNGRGTGPQIGFLPSIPSNFLPLLSQMNPGGIAVDGGGNLYIADYDNNEVLKETLSGGKYSESTIGSGWNSPRAIAVDGAGNIYIAESGKNRVVMETPSGTSYVQSIVAGGLGYPSGVAVDGSGNVYIADSQNNQIQLETLTAGTYAQSTIPTSGLNWPNGIAVDGNGNIYIADQYNNRVLKEAVSSNGYSQTTVVGNLNNPRGVAVDSNGDIYITDSQSNQLLEEIPSTNGYTTYTLDSDISYPCWVALDGSGNPIVSGYSVVKEDVSDPRSINYESTVVGSKSADSPKAITIANDGNAPLNFAVPSSGSNPSISPNFTVDASSSCPQLNSNSAPGTLPAGASCVYALDFSPTNGGNISGSFLLSDNNLNSASGVQSISLNGVGIWAATVTVTPSSNSITTAQALTVTVTVSGGTGSPVPTGVVVLSSGSFASAVTPLSGGTAQINVPAGALTAGSDILTANYTPDANSSSTYKSASGSASSAVIVSLTIPVMTVSPSSTSITTTQALTVTVIVAGTPTPTGSVILSSGSYSSAATSLSGGSAQINVPAGSLSTGSDLLTASYTPDSNSSSIYNDAIGTNSVTVTQAKTTPTVTVSPSSSSITTAQPLTVTVTVAGSPTPTGSVILSSGSYTSTATTLSAGSTQISIPAGALAIGTDTLTASYTPDSSSSSTYNGAAGTNSVTVTQAKTTPTVTVTPSTPSITTAQPLAVTVNVAGTPTPTGSVTLTGGGYTSAATTLSGGSATINIPANSLSAGTDSLTASYTPDSSSSSTYNSATGTYSVTVTQTKSTPTITVTPGASSITTTQALSVTVTVNGGTGNPTPTGNATLTSGKYTSAAMSLNSGSATITVPADTLAVGADALSVAYGGDSIYSGTAGTGSVTVTLSTASLTVTPVNNGTFDSSQTESVTVAVAGAGPVPTGTITLSGDGYSSGSTALTSGGAAITIPSNEFTMAGSITLTANYSGDGVYASGSGTSNITVNAPYSVATTTPSAINPGSNATATVTLTADQSYSGTVTLSCALTSSPNGAQELPTCTVTSGSFITITNGTASSSATVTLSTTAASSATFDKHGLPGWTRAGGEMALAMLVFLGIPARRRSWRKLLGLAVVMAVLGTLSACGGGGGTGGGGGGGGNPGTTAGNYTFTVTGTGSPGVSPAPTAAVKLTVN